jgi:SAM-dependent methyltransferase
LFEERKEISYTVFDENVDRYESWFQKNKVTAENEVRAVKILGAPKNPSLEVGVGTGFFASKLGINFGIDPALKMLLIASSRGINVVRGFGEHPPFRPRSFYSIYIIVTICFVQDPLKLLLRARDLLREKGFLVTCFIPRDSSWGEYYIIRKNLGESVFYTYASFLSRHELLSMLGEAGFIVASKSSVLSYAPQEKPFLENPRTDDKGSFVCYKSHLVR